VKVLIKITQPIIVEGKYDKITLGNVVDTLIITTNGFSLFRDKEKCELIRTLAKRDGVIVLTDSDSAGNLIRSHIKNIADGGKIINVYVPMIKGKEKRKTVSSKEGFLGVEGMSKQVIEEALRKSGVLCRQTDGNAPKITKTDMYLLGLSGEKNSSLKRKKLLEFLKLPNNLSPNALLDVINTLFTKEEFLKAVEKCLNPGDKN
jgi:ribonuclease M5